MDKEILYSDQLLGIQYAGNLEKKRDGAVWGGWAHRLFALTGEALYYFRKVEEGQLLGEERGRIDLRDISSVRVLTAQDVPDEGTGEGSGLDFEYLEITENISRKILLRSHSSLGHRCEIWSDKILTAIADAATRNFKPVAVASTLNAELHRLRSEPPSLPLPEVSAVIVSRRLTDQRRDKRGSCETSCPLTGSQREPSVWQDYSGGVEEEIIWRGESRASLRVNCTRTERLSIIFANGTQICLLGEELIDLGMNGGEHWTELAKSMPASDAFAANENKNEMLVRVTMSPNAEVNQRAKLQDVGLQPASSGAPSRHLRQRERHRIAHLLAATTALAVALKDQSSKPSFVLQVSVLLCGILLASLLHQTKEYHSQRLGGVNAEVETDCVRQEFLISFLKLRETRPEQASRLGH